MSESDQRRPPTRPTAQGPNAAGPDNAHYGPPRDAPGPWGTGEEPFDPEGGKPAANPEKAAADLLAHSKDGEPIVGQAGPEATRDESKTGRG